MSEKSEASVWELKAVRQGTSQTLSLDQMPGYRTASDFHRDVPVEVAKPVALDMAARERELRQTCAELAKELSYAADVSVRQIHAAWKRQGRGQAQADASVTALDKKRTWLQRSLRAGRLV